MRNGRKEMIMLRSVTYAYRAAVYTGAQKASDILRQEGLQVKRIITM